jgi:predicted nuclease of predicted toxin-antitoxin system
MLSSKPIRFLIDESCDYTAVRALRAAGYDVVSVAESFPSTSDFDVLKVALHSESVLLTEDKDFGDWVFAHGEQITGVVLIRFPASVRKRIGESVIDLVREHGPELKKSFTVLEPGRARIRKMKSQVWTT